MKRVALIMPYGGVGGIERLVAYLYSHYKNLNYTVKVIKIIKLDTDLVQFGEDEYALSECDFIEMSKVGRLLFYLQAPIHLRRILKQEAITHSIAFGDMANLFSSLTFTKEYKVASIHALKSVEFLNPSYINTVYKLAYRTTYNKFNKVVCISKSIRHDLIDKCNFKFHDKLKVIYNPHDIELIRQKAIQPLEPFEEMCFEGKTILFLGRISLQKAPWHLIKSFSILSKQLEKVTLVFIGDGDPSVQAYCNHLVNHFQLENKVLFLGRRDNPYKYLKRSDVVALTSYYEGTPNVIVEAIALGIPVVTSNCTDGIIELMTSSPPLITEEGFYETETGIITPSFFKGQFNMPNSDDYIQVEYAFSNALLRVIEGYKTNDDFQHVQKDLLKKFDLNQVAANYFKD